MVRMVAKPSPHGPDRLRAHRGCLELRLGTAMSAAYSRSVGGRGERSGDEDYVVIVYRPTGVINN
jgi:hypothetical protein